MAWCYTDGHDVLYGCSGDLEVLNVFERLGTHNFGLSYIPPKFCLLPVYCVLFSNYLYFAILLCKLCLKDLNLYSKSYFSPWHIQRCSEKPVYNPNKNKTEKKLSCLFSILCLVFVNWSVLMSYFIHFKVCVIWSITANHTKSIL